MCLLAVVMMLMVALPMMCCAQVQVLVPQREAARQEQRVAQNERSEPTLSGETAVGGAPEFLGRARSGLGRMSGGLSGQMDMSDMAGIEMPADGAATLQAEESSGTSVQPRGWAMPMVMTQVGGWQLSWMAQAFGVDVQQSHVLRTDGSGRGSDAAYSTNWGMLGARHALGGGSAMLRTMVSLEPATITGRRYPELFQTGETAFGRGIVDGQHPHNLLMEIGGQYAHSVGSAVVSGYYAPVGDPALGPTAYPHRASAAELPQAALGHHYEDSTHIAYNVATAEVAWKRVHLEASGLHGREPGENRWALLSGAGFGMDSWTARATWLPAQDWQAQVSTGWLHHPEVALGDEERTTASVEWARGGRAASVIWGRDWKTAGQYGVNAVTVEGVTPVGKNNDVTGRCEWTQRDELQVGTSRWFDVSAYTAGYTRVVKRWKDAEFAVGANGTGYVAGAGLSSVYGERPWGASAFVRVRLRPGMDGAASR